MKWIPHRMTRNRLRPRILDTHPEVDIHPPKLDQNLTPRSNHPVTHPVPVIHRTLLIPPAAHPVIHPVLVIHPDLPDILQNPEVPVTRREALAILLRLDIHQEAHPVTHQSLDTLREALLVIHQSLDTLREALPVIHQDPVTHLVVVILVARILHRVQEDIHRPPSMREV